jgi:uncharacterized protein YjbI with pentapeptide repeats
MPSSNPAQLPVHGRFTFASIIPRFNDTAIALLNGDLGSALQAFSGALGGKNDEAAVQAYTLLWQSMKGAARNIIARQLEEHHLQPQAQVEAYGLTQSFCQDLWQQLPKLELVVDRDFVDNPMQHPSTQALQHYFRDWLQKELNLHPDAARVACAAFPRLMLTEMAALARSEFRQLFDYFEKPFLPAEEKAQAMDAYQANVMSMFHRPAFNNQQVSLAEMYVPPFFRFFKPEKEAGDEAQRSKGDFVFPKKKIQLQTMLDQWLQGKCPGEIRRKDARVLLVLGQPGQGKSSFCQQSAHRLLAEERGLVSRVFLLRLRDLENRPEFIQKPIEIALAFFNDYEFRKNKLERHDLQNSLLILDGLDEFYMNNGLSHQDIDTLLGNLEREVRLENEHSNPFHCLLTSRNHYVQLDRQKSSDLLIWQISEMSLEEQNDWLSRYEQMLDRVPTEEAAGKKLFVKQLRPELENLAQSEDEKDENLRELMNQPILLQIMVEAQISPTKANNRAALYEELFDRIVRRSWDKGQIPALRALTEEEGRGLFREFLRALALHIFYSENEYARRSDFKTEPLAKAVKNLREAFGQQDPDHFVKNLLISFYFKEVRKNTDDRPVQDEQNNYAYEFLHKSLQEYLVAEAIWTYFRDELCEVSTRTKRLVKDDHTAMEEIFQLFSPRVMTSEIVGYLYEFARKDKAPDYLQNTLFLRCKALMQAMGKHSFLWTYRAADTAPPARRCPAPLEQAVAVFYGLLIISGALVNRLTESIAWPNATQPDYHKRHRVFTQQWDFLGPVERAVDLLVLLTRQVVETYLHLSGANLSGANLSGANLSGANFSGADLSDANLSGANLSSADLTRAYLIEADLAGADLTGADLIGANLAEAYLTGAYLSGVDLSGAHLSAAYLSDADLSGAYLSDADLSGASLNRANLTGADLTGADLTGADLTGADLFGANLYRAKFNSRENVQPARNLNNIKNLHHSRNLDKADWSGTPFEGRDWTAWVAEETAKEKAANAK